MSEVTTEQTLLKATSTGYNAAAIELCLPINHSEKWKKQNPECSRNIGRIYVKYCDYSGDCRKQHYIMISKAEEICLIQKNARLLLVRMGL